MRKWQPSLVSPGYGQMDLRDTRPPAAQMGKLRPGAASDAALTLLLPCRWRACVCDILWVPPGACVLLLTSTRTTFREAIAEGVMQVGASGPWPGWKGVAQPTTHHIIAQTWCGFHHKLGTWAHLGKGESAAGVPSRPSMHPSWTPRSSCRRSRARRSVCGLRVCTGRHGGRRWQGPVVLPLPSARLLKCGARASAGDLTPLLIRPEQDDTEPEQSPAAPQETHCVRRSPQFGNPHFGSLLGPCACMVRPEETSGGRGAGTKPVFVVGRK